MYINRLDGLMEVTVDMVNNGYLTVTEEAEWNNQDRARVNVSVKTYQSDGTGIVEIDGKTISIHTVPAHITHCGAFKQCINYLNAHGYNIDVNYDNITFNGTLLN